MENTSNRKRKWTPKEKLEIVLEGIASGNVNEVCRRRGLNVNQYYNWKNKLFKNVEKIFEREDKKQKAREEKLEEVIKKKDEIIAEVTEENLNLKKGRWP